MGGGSGIVYLRASIWSWNFRGGLGARGLSFLGFLTGTIADLTKHGIDCLIGS